MATIVLTPLVANGKVTAPSALAITADNTYQAVPTNRVQMEQVLLQVVVATAPTTVTIKAGTQPLAIASGQGDLVFTNLAVGTHFVGPLESGRFQQNDGTLQIKAATAANVSVAALQHPRSV